jgi:hypothetical protein
MEMYIQNLWIKLVMLFAVHEGQAFRLRHLFCSEAPGPIGTHQKTLLALNLMPDVIFDNLLAWVFSSCF